MEKRKNLTDTAIEWVKIKPEYRYLPDDEWVSMDPVLKEGVHGIYFANKNMQIKNIRTGVVKNWWEHHIKCGYFQTTFSNSEAKIKYGRGTHLVLGELFFTNYYPKGVKTHIDHIYRDTLSISIQTLRRASITENNKNRVLGVSSKFYLLKYTIDKQTLLEKLEYTKINKDKINSIRKYLIQNEGEWEGFYYRFVDIYVEEALEKYGQPTDNLWNPNNPDIPGWKESWEYPGIWCYSIGGFIKQNGKLTLGNYKKNGYFMMCIGYDQIQSNILIPETFYGIKIPKGLQVCHEDANSKNNSLSNLVIGDGKYNMSNKFTKERLSTPVIMIDPDTFEKYEFNSVTNASEITGIYSTDIVDSCNWRIYLAGGFLWSYKGMEQSSIDRFKSFLNSGKVPFRWWENKDRCKKEAMKYKNRNEFGKKSSGAYASSLKNGWLDEFFPGKVDWNSKNNCLLEANKYKRRNDFCNGSPGAYASSLRNGWLDEFFPDTLKKQERGYWNIKKNCETEAKNYKTKKEFREKSPSAYSSSIRHKWIDEWFSKERSDKETWTKESCIEEAKKYKNRSEFCKKKRSAYYFAKENGFLEDLTYSI